jgi:hypothetical protein
MLHDTDTLGTLADRYLAAEDAQACECEGSGLCSCVGTDRRPAEGPCPKCSGSRYCRLCLDGEEVADLIEGEAS